MSSFMSFAYIFLQNFIMAPGCWGDPRRLRLQLYHFFQPMGPSNVLVVFHGRTRQDGMFRKSTRWKWREQSGCVRIFKFEICQDCDFLQIPSATTVPLECPSGQQHVPYSWPWRRASLRICLAPLIEANWPAGSDWGAVLIFLKEQWFESDSKFVWYQFAYKKCYRHLVPSPEASTL